MHPDVIGGRYRVGRPIGRGGMGTVWLCRDEKLRRDVAVKQVGLLPGASATDSARALREARSSAALSHRNVVTVFDVVEEDQAIWLVMEHVPSRSLAELITQEGPLDPARVADIGAQVADGLAAAHAAGTIHRDVKPGNVLVRDDGLAKISDFGIARTTGDPTVTQSGLLTGTPSYFSPELARGEPPTPSSDVWALGATLYAAVEGRPPYRPQENPVAVLHEIATRQPTAPTRAGYLEPVLLRMLDRDPVARWSMADAAHALHRLAAEHVPDRTRVETLADPLPTAWPDPSWTAPPQEHPRAAPLPSATSRSGSDGAAPRRSAPQVVERAAPSPRHPPPARERDRSTHPVGHGAGDGAGDGAGHGDGAGERPGPVGVDSAGGRPDRPLRGYAVAAVVVLVLAVAGVAYALTRAGGPADPSSAARGTSSSSSPPGDSPSSSASRPPSSSAGRSSSATGSPRATGSPTPSAKQPSPASFLRGYFAVAPGGTDRGWAQLGPHERAQGRPAYDRFWRGIASVEVRDIVPVAGTDSVELTVTYHETNGQVSTERQRLDLVRSPSGGYLIDNDDVIG